MPTHSKPIDTPKVNCSFTAPYPVAQSAPHVTSITMPNTRTQHATTYPKVYQHAPYGFIAVGSANYPPPPPAAAFRQCPPSLFPASKGSITPSTAVETRIVAAPIGLGDYNVEPNVVRVHSTLSDTASQHSSAPHLSPEQRDSDDEDSFLAQSVTPQSLQQCQGRIAHTACTSHGSSFLQYALRKFPSEAFQLISAEVIEAVDRLVLDKNGCYVVKAVLEMMHRDEVIPRLHGLATNKELLVSLCTKDLHTRRMIQFFLEFEGRKSNIFCVQLYQLLMTTPMAIVGTQQGCITAQRILDHCTRPEKESFFRLVRHSLWQFALDPFGHYIVEYMLAEGNQTENSAALLSVWSGNFATIACNRNASTILEKCFGLVTPALQAQIVEELFGGPDPVLVGLLRNEQANYVIQAAIRAASFRDVVTIQQRTAHLIHLAAFSKKIHSRLQRRLAQGH